MNYNKHDVLIVFRDRYCAIDINNEGKLDITVICKDAAYKIKISDEQYREAGYILTHGLLAQFKHMLISLVNEPVLDKSNSIHTTCSLIGNIILQALKMLYKYFEHRMSAYLSIPEPTETIHVPKRTVPPLRPLKLRHEVVDIVSGMTKDGSCVAGFYYDTKPQYAYKIVAKEAIECYVLRNGKTTYHTYAAKYYSMEKQYLLYEWAMKCDPTNYTLMFMDTILYHTVDDNVVPTIAKHLMGQFDCFVGCCKS